MEETKTELQLIKLSEIQSQEVSWLWFPFIPYGKLTIIQGDPGDGKTTFILNIAAKLSKGESLDGGMSFTEPLNVIYQSAEDGLADTIKPRLEQAKADCEKISVIDEKIKSLSMIDERLEQAVIKTGAKLLILDQIQAYLGGGMDMNRANEARDMTKKLAALAEKYQCAIVLVGHMNKAAGNKAAYRGMGSIDFFAVARSVLLVGRVEGEENTRAVVQIKNNLAAFGHPKAFALSEDGFQWLGDYEITADEVLGSIAPKANKMEQAKRLLRELAETNNAMQSNEIFNLADEQGISKHLSVLDFEKKERAKEVAELEQTISGSKEELSDILYQKIAAGQETEQIRKEGEAIRQKVSELSATNLLLKEQTEILAEDKEKLLSENEKLEKQQKKLQQEINKMVQSKEVMERNIHAYDEDVKWQLAEPGALMSAKNYRDKKDLPLVERLKEVVKNLTIKCVQLMEQSRKLTAKVDGQQVQISRLTDKVMEQSNIIDRLQEKASDLERLERHLGREQVQSIVERSKALEQAERAKKRSKRAFEMSR